MKSVFQTNVLRLLPVLLLLASATVASAGKIGEGNLVVLQVGDGVNTYASSTGAPVFLREFTTAGTAVNVNDVAIPNSVASQRLVLSVNAAEVGQLTRSVDQRYLTLAGFDQALNGTVSISTARINRSVAVVDAWGNTDTSTSFLAAGAEPRSVVSSNGTDLWIGFSTGSGVTGGVRYLTKGSTTNGTGLNSTTSNIRSVNIVNGNLYASAVASSRIHQFGTGLPTIASSTTAFPGITAGTVFDFFLADSNTLYLAESATTTPLGLQKWRFDGTNWVLSWSAQPGGQGIRTLTGVTDGTSATLYMVTSNGQSLYSVNDTLSGVIAPTFGLPLATAPANTVWRGVELAPIPEPGTIGLAVATAVIGLVAVRRRK